MSKLAAFDELLQQYKTFNYHDNPVLAQRLQDVQTWLKERMKETHHDFFNLPEASIHDFIISDLERVKYLTVTKKLTKGTF